MSIQPDLACCVCEEPVDELNSSECDNCGRLFHLKKRLDRPGKDCGDVQISPETMALEFACNSCGFRSQGWGS